MGYLEFTKNQLVNLKQSLSIENLETNASGSFLSTTLVFCNTRKYHGLLIVPQEKLDAGYHVLLSSLDETLIQKDKEFHLAVHKYPGMVHSGHKYITDFSADPIPTIYYTAGDVSLKKELLLMEKEHRVMVRYTVLDWQSPATIRLHPFLAFRNIHALSKANFDVNTQYSQVKNGIATRLYSPYPHLYMQLSRKNAFVAAPDWFYNLEYEKELERGYEAHEDLFVPGFFEFQLRKGQSIVFTAGLKESAPNQLNRTFDAELKKRTAIHNFDECLDTAADQFLVHDGKSTKITAYYPWAVKQPREALIALPGLTLARGKTAAAEAVLDDLTRNRQGSHFQIKNDHNVADIPSADTPLWYFWAVQKYAGYTGRYGRIQKHYWKAMKDILAIYRRGTDYQTGMDQQGLLHAGNGEVPLTWMNASANGEPVTPRNGYPVELNALWYNAVQFALELAERFKEQAFIDEWKDVPARFEAAFKKHFWDKEKNFLRDVYQPERGNSLLRPNQVFALSMPYVPVKNSIRKAVLEVLEQDLLTIRGLRTLSPKNGRYIGIYVGNAYDREIAMHQGSVFPWLLGHFAEAYLKVHGSQGVRRTRKIYREFEKEMRKNGLGHLSELYDGNPPHQGRGAIASAVNVAELIRLKTLLDSYKK